MVCSLFLTAFSRGPLPTARKYRSLLFLDSVFAAIVNSSAPLTCVRRPRKSTIVLSCGRSYFSLYSVFLWMFFRYFSVSIPLGIMYIGFCVYFLA